MSILFVEIRDETGTNPANTVRGGSFLVHKRPVNSNQQATPAGNAAWIA